MCYGNHLGRRVGGRADQRRPTAGAAAIQSGGSAKIAEPYLAGESEQDVTRLDVRMHDTAHIVQMRKRTEQLPHQVWRDLSYCRPSADS